MSSRLSRMGAVEVTEGSSDLWYAIRQLKNAMDSSYSGLQIITFKEERNYFDSLRLVQEQLPKAIQILTLMTNRAKDKGHSGELAAMLRKETLRVQSLVDELLDSNIDEYIYAAHQLFGLFPPGLFKENRSSISRIVSRLLNGERSPERVVHSLYSWLGKYEEANNHRRSSEHAVTIELIADEIRVYEVLYCETIS